ncbi:polysaccharide deacetylase family protein [Rhodanobacter sp. 7MK24]|uniref:polysaccharide deacetylase family protein n=1 Tax=Rhodanobacter sp. 7MK24 TaxID=2775922 RepID=UPI00177EA7F9|nr:polysaccharide deacetylase family protein [Rhodanobacter sp. 7MK24]MBD8882438.1 polysaccharide deacetylase family protein [Rhodanobacter sp. 7MK24]
MSTGTFTISIDFELYWGVRDTRGLDAFRNRLDGARKAIPRMLDLFEQHQVHATWATVGFLFCRNRDAALSAAPTVKPGYKNSALCPYRYLEQSADLDGRYHFAPDLVDLIAATPGQEIASHTFSHYYCREAGQTVAAFRADLAAAVRTAAAQGIALRSLVFPRNQWNPDYLEVLAEHGIGAYRGNEHGWLYAATDRVGQNAVRRMGRLLDSYINLSGHHTYALESCAGRPPLNFPASRFLRPHNPRLAWADGLRLRRITHAMRHAAKRQEVFHLWWHPHNFGIDTDQNMGFLERVIEEFERLRQHEGMRSLGMAELADALAAQ